MKAVFALALAGSALAGGYGPASSAPADPVVPSKGYGGDYAKPSSTPADPVVPSKGGYGSKPSSTPADPVVPSKGGYGGEWPKSSSTPAAAVTPSKGGYGGDWSKSSSTVSAKPSGKPTWGDDEEDCDEEDGEWDDDSEGAWPSKSKGSWSKPASSTVSAKPTWSKKPWGGEGDDEDCTTSTWEEEGYTTYVKPTSWVDGWGNTKTAESTVTVKVTSTKTATITRSKSATAAAWTTPAYFDTLACCKTIVTVTEWVSAGYVKPSYTPAAPAVPSYTPSGEWDHDWSYSKPAASSSTPAAPVAPSYTPKGEWDHDWTPASSSAPAAPSASKPAWSGNGPIVNNGDKWGMTYTPYTKDGQCKTADEVDADIAKIKSYGFTTVRLYATDCSGLINVGASTKKYDLKIILGVFVDKKGLQASWSQVDEIAAWGKSGGWDNVVMVVVGNEAVFNGYCAAQELADYVTKVKGYLAENGYGGWTTTTEPVYIIEQNTCLCGAVDVAAANVQPFFTSSIGAASAGDFVLGQLAQVEAACGKTAYNLECGWPSSGSANGAAVPSKEDQKTAILDIIAKAGKKTCIFSFEDDAWKDGGEFGVEKSWGCGDVFSGY